MIKKTIVILVFVYISFVLEIALFRHFGAWGKPELLTLMVVFFSLFLGIRWGVVAALAAGLLRDGFALVPSGTYVIVYLCVAYGIVFLRKFLFQPGSRFSRLVMAWMGVMLAWSIRAFLEMTRQELYWQDLLSFVLIQQLAITLLCATTVFTFLKNVSERLRLK